MTLINNYLIKIIEDLEEVRELDILESAHNENEFEEAYHDGANKVYNHIITLLKKVHDNPKYLDQITGEIEAMNNCYEIIFERNDK